MEINIKDFKVKELKKIKIMGMPWDTTVYCILSNQKDPVDAQEKLNELMIHIKKNSTYKSLEVLNVQTNYKLNEILDNKIHYDIGSISIDQKHFKLGQKVQFKIEGTPKDTSVTHYSSHQLIKDEFKDYIPDIPLLIQKNDTSIKIDCEVVENKNGSHTLCYVNAQNELIVKYQNNYDFMGFLGIK